LQSSDDSSTLVSVISFPEEESRMTTVEFITALFYEVDEQLHASNSRRGLKPNIHRDIPLVFS
jgi:hypothetical protein